MWDDDCAIPLPLTMGHETVGEVAAVGPQAVDVKIGEVHLIYPWIGCGQCPMCLAGDENLCEQPRFLGIDCDGGYADHILGPHPRYLLNLNGLDPVTAAPYACSGLAAYTALQKVADVLEREPIMIIGADGAGLAALTFLPAMGGKGAFVVDIDERNRRAALKAGAIAAIDGTTSDASQKVIQSAGGPISAAIDLVGNSQSAALGLDCLAKGGKLIIVGSSGGAASWALSSISKKAVMIQGSYLGNLAELKRLLDLVRQQSVPPIPVITRPLAEANEALEELRRHTHICQTVLLP
jgi:D-arabinose 1-dehydrogenase-like Zn-dependent alcohol dehydrogenase